MRYVPGIFVTIHLRTHPIRSPSRFPKPGVARCLEVRISWFARIWDQRRGPKSRVARESSRSPGCRNATLPHLSEAQVPGFTGRIGLPCRIHASFRPADRSADEETRLAFRRRDSRGFARSRRNGFRAFLGGVDVGESLRWGIRPLGGNNRIDESFRLGPESFGDVWGHNVSGQSQGSERQDRQVSQVNFPPTVSVPGTTLRGVMIVVPAFPAGKQGNDPIISAVIVGVIVPIAPAVRHGIHRPGDMPDEDCSNHDPPNKNTQAELDRLRDGLQLTKKVGCGSAIAGEEYDIELLERELVELERR